MTGFGRGTVDRDGMRASVELRSVNNRYLDVSSRLPRSLAERESELQTRIRNAFDRGRISVQVQVEEDAEEVVPIRVDVHAARAYRKLLDGLREAAGIEEPVRLEQLLTFSDVFTTEEPENEHSKRLWDHVVAALDEAISDLQRMRREEGRALEADLEDRLAVLDQNLAAVEERAPVRITEARERLEERLTDLLGDERVNRDRLELELVLYADKLDVTEECVRLRSHVNLFREALASEDSVGRRLNFLVQEMNREINTIGSKSNDSAVAHRAVSMKEELEKIREQVQNIE